LRILNETFLRKINAVVANGKLLMRNYLKKQEKGEEFKIKNLKKII
jgi:hypothetical protein